MKAFPYDGICGDGQQETGCQEEKMNNFMESLKIMAAGMAGIYAAALVFAGMMKALTALFPGTKRGQEKQE